MEEKEYSDIDMATDQLKDEISGIAAYKRMSEEATCPALKKIADDNGAWEKEHAKKLVLWIHNHLESL
jgi:hypothetical protein